jgi:hypothetical protein
VARSRRLRCRSFFAALCPHCVVPGGVRASLGKRQGGAAQQPGPVILGPQKDPFQHPEQNNSSSKSITKDRGLDLARAIRREAEQASACLPNKDVRSTEERQLKPAILVLSKDPFQRPRAEDPVQQCFLKGSSDSIAVRFDQLLKVSGILRFARNDRSTGIPRCVRRLETEFFWFFEYYRGL